LPVINNILPNTQASEYEKMFFKTQSEAIAYYQKCLQDERKQFADERNILTVKTEEKNDEILSLNLKINELKTAVTADYYLQNRFLRFCFVIKN
jgi:uncharacterized glyoxalase superfamily protein PhnB